MVSSFSNFADIDRQSQSHNVLVVYETLLVGVEL